MFKVTKDASRPFIVNAGSAVVRAVGTRFGVERREDRVRVTVAEGQVASCAADRPPRWSSGRSAASRLALVADERVEIPVNAPTVPLHVEKVNSAHALAWANGQLIFQNETLGEAVGEFNRRNRVQIRVDDPEIAAWHVCCVFDAADPEAFAKGHRGYERSTSCWYAKDRTLCGSSKQAPGQAVPPDSDGAI